MHRAPSLSPRNRRRQCCPGVLFATAIVSLRLSSDLSARKAVRLFVGHERLTEFPALLMVTGRICANQHAATMSLSCQDLMSATELWYSSHESKSQRHSSVTEDRHRRCRDAACHLKVSIGRLVSMP